MSTDVEKKSKKFKKLRKLLKLNILNIFLICVLVLGVIFYPKNFIDSDVKETLSFCWVLIAIMLTIFVFIMPHYYEETKKQLRIIQDPNYITTMNSTKKNKFIDKLVDDVNKSLYNRFVMISLIMVCLFKLIFTTAVYYLLGFGNSNDMHITLALIIYVFFILLIKLFSNEISIIMDDFIIFNEFKNIDK